eukprot:gene9791-11498_t
MQHNEPSYDIHEKIAQLETELLQHELLIRRQKHVISSLKTMITSPQRAWNNSDETVVQTAPRTIATSSSAASSARSNKASSKGPPVPPPVSTAAQASTSGAGAQRKNGTATSAIAERPINRHKKKSAIKKVFQYCASIPKFGAAVAPKRKRSTVNVVEESEGQASKRARVPNAPGETSNSSTSGTSSSGQRRVSHSSVAALSAEEEDAEDLADEEAFLATAGAKLSYLNAMRAQNRSAQTNTSTSSSTYSNINSSLSQQRVSPRPVMVPVQLRPSASVQQSQPAAVRNTNSSSKSEQKNGNNPSTNSITSSSSGSKARLTGMESSISVPRPTTTAVPSVSSNKSIVKPVTIATPTSSKQSTNTATATATKLNATTLSGLTTPTLNNNAPFPSSVSLTSPITSPRNLLTGSTHKNKAIYEYCQQVRSLEEKLEVAKDMHSNILSNPRRLQQFLDSTGGRDLFLSWLTEGMERIEAGDLRADEELAQTKLMEYTVLLINQAYWNAKSVSELKFDKTLKALYRLFEDRRGPHHVTVSNIVKGIWPSYRIMRKQHEASSKGSNKNNNVFVVD